MLATSPILQILYVHRTYTSKHPMHLVPGGILDSTPYTSFQRLQCRFPKIDPSPLVRLRQSIEGWHRTSTIETPIPRFLRQNPRIHPGFPTPLYRTLCYPSPVEPTPAELKTRHLRLGVRHEPLLVSVAVCARIGVCAATGAGAGIGRA